MAFGETIFILHNTIPTLVDDRESPDEWNSGIPIDSRRKILHDVTESGGESVVVLGGLAKTGNMRSRVRSDNPTYSDFGVRFDELFLIFL